MATARWIRTSARALDSRRGHPRYLPAGQQRRAAAGLAAGLGHLRGRAAGSARRSRPTGTARPSRTHASPTTSSGRRAAGTAGASRPSVGRAKLPFNVDWAAKWSHFDVTVEGCGKDLATKGGSRDRSDAVSREVYDREPPLNVAYEFLNIGGRKMSTSQGSGAAAHEMADLLPPELLALPLPAPQAAPRHRVRPRRRRDPGALRRVRPGRRGDRGRARSAASCRPTPSASSRRASWTPTRTSRPRRPATDRRSATWRCSPRSPASTSRRASRPRRARRSTRRSGRSSSERARVATDAGSRASRRSATASRCCTTLPDLAEGLTEAQALFLADLATGAGVRATERRATPGRTSSTAPPSGAASRRATRSRRCTRRSSDARTDRAPAGCSRVSTPRWSSRGCAPRPQRALTPRSAWTGRALRSRGRMSVGAVAPPRPSPTSSVPARSRRARTRRSWTRPSLPTSGAAPCSASADALRAERKRVSESVGVAIRGGADPRGPEVAALRERSIGDGRRDRRARCAGRGCRGRPRGPAPAHPQPARRGHPGRRRGGERRRADVGRAGAPRGAGGAGPATPGLGAALGGRRVTRASSTWPRARRSRARASRSTAEPGRHCSGPSSTASSSSIPASTA